MSRTSKVLTLAIFIGVMLVEHFGCDGRQGRALPRLRAARTRVLARRTISAPSRMPACALTATRSTSAIPGTSQRCPAHAGRPDRGDSARAGDGRRCARGQRERCAAIRRRSLDPCPPSAFTRHASPRPGIGAPATSRGRWGRRFCSPRRVSASTAAVSARAASSAIAHAASFTKGLGFDPCATPEYQHHDGLEVLAVPHGRGLSRGRQHGVRPAQPDGVVGAHRDPRRAGTSSPPTLACRHQAARVGLCRDQLVPGRRAGRGRRGRRREPGPSRESRPRQPDLLRHGGLLHRRERHVHRAEVPLRLDDHAARRRISVRRLQQRCLRHHAISWRGRTPRSSSPTTSGSPTGMERHSTSDPYVPSGVLGRASADPPVLRRTGRHLWRRDAEHRRRLRRRRHGAGAGPRFRTAPSSRSPARRPSTGSPAVRRCSSAAGMASAARSS